MDLANHVLAVKPTAGTAGVMSVQTLSAVSCVSMGPDVFPRLRELQREALGFARDSD
jgi:hypothetical protein